MVSIAYRCGLLDLVATTQVLFIAACPRPARLKRPRISKQTDHDTSSGARSRRCWLEMLISRCLQSSRASVRTSIPSGRAYQVATVCGQGCARSRAAAWRDLLLAARNSPVYRCSGAEAALGGAHQGATICAQHVHAPGAAARNRML
jgi:hypothetical protein